MCNLGYKIRVPCAANCCQKQICIKYTQLPFCTHLAPNVLIFHQLKGEVDNIMQDLEKRVAKLLNVGLSAGHLFTLSTGRVRGSTLATRREVPPLIEL